MDTEPCLVCDACPCVLIAVSHPAMRRLILDLLNREHGCWKACLLAGELGPTVEQIDPDLVLIDDRDFPRRCRQEMPAFALSRVIVLGPEPDPAYRTAAFGNGAGGWVARDDLAARLSVEMRHALGCNHGPCPTPS